jgi:hypothetical protein
MTVIPKRTSPFLQSRLSDHGEAITFARVLGYRFASFQLALAPASARRAGMAND